MGDSYVARVYDSQFTPLQMRTGSLRTQPMAISLDKLQMYSIAFHGNHAYRVFCEVGTLWLTAGHCSRDFVMESGDEFSFNARQKVSIVALPSCVVQFMKSRNSGFSEHRINLHEQRTFTPLRSN